LAGLGVFQAALARGRRGDIWPWGGKYKELPPLMRGGSFLAIILYGIGAAIIVQRAGVCDRAAAGHGRYRNLGGRRVPAARYRDERRVRAACRNGWP
jgi:hypothetical protein